MKKYYNTFDYIRYIEQQNENRKNAIKAIECIIDTILAFDGKMYTIRFNKACTDNFNTVNLPNTFIGRESYGMWHLYVRDGDSYKQDKDSQYSSWNYINYTYYLPVLYGDDKRIYSDILVPLFRERQNTIQKQIDTSITEIGQLHAIESEYNTIKERIKLFNNTVTPELRELFTITNIY